MSLQDFARKREIQILTVFGLVTLTAYYFWLKKQKEGLGWANASGTTRLPAPKECTNVKPIGEAANFCTTGCFKMTGYENCVCKAVYRQGYEDYFDCKTGGILSVAKK